MGTVGTTRALQHALDLEQERSRTLEAVVKALQTELRAERVKVTALQAQLDELRPVPSAARRLGLGGGIGTRGGEG